MQFTGHEPLVFLWVACEELWKSLQSSVDAPVFGISKKYFLPKISVFCLLEKRHPSTSGSETRVGCCALVIVSDSEKLWKGNLDRTFVSSTIPLHWSSRTIMQKETAQWARPARWPQEKMKRTETLLVAARFVAFWFGAYFCFSLDCWLGWVGLRLVWFLVAWLLAWLVDWLVCWLAGLVLAFSPQGTETALVFGFACPCEKRHVAAESFGSIPTVANCHQLSGGAGSVMSSFSRKRRDWGDRC